MEKFREIKDGKAHGPSEVYAVMILGNRAATVGSFMELGHKIPDEMNTSNSGMHYECYTYYLKKQRYDEQYYLIILIILIFDCYFSREHIAFLQTKTV